MMSIIIAGCGGGSAGSSDAGPQAVAGVTQTAPAPAPIVAPAPAPSPAPASAPNTAQAEIATRSAEGLWIGAAGSYSTTAVVLADGQYWMTYHQNGVTQAVVQGTSQAASGLFDGTDAKVLKGDTATTGAVSGQFVSRQSFGGVISGAEAAGLQFTMNYSSSYQTTAQTASIAGTWTTTLPGGRTAQMAVAASGLVSGTDSAGCSFTGYVQPRSTGENVYSLTMAFGGAPCVLADKATAGVAYLVPSGSGANLVTAVADDYRAGGFGAMFSRSSGAAPAPAPAPAPPPAALVDSPPITEPSRFITGAELLNVIKGYAPSPLGIVHAGGPPTGYLFLSIDGSARYGSPSGITGSLYAWSQLMWGGQGTVSRITSSVNGRPGIDIEFLVASGQSGYVANMTLRSGSDRIDFDGLHTINEWDRVPVDREVFTWRKAWASGSALVRLIVQSIDGSPTGFRVCWLTQYGALNRLACTVHGRPYAAYVIDDYFGSIQRAQSTVGDIPWRIDPPAGTPAPAPNPGPLRFVYGSRVASLLASPLPGADAATGASVTLRDGSGLGGTLSARRVLTGPQYGGLPATASLSSTVDGRRTADISYLVAYNPYSMATAVTGLALDYAGEAVPMPGNWPFSSTEIYPLDATLFEGRAGTSIARLILQSVEGPRDAFRLCWLMQHRSLNRLVCGVGDLPGTIGFMIDDNAGEVRTFR